MPLRGTKPTAIAKRPKILIYGEPGTRKTSTAIKFPSPYFIDCERGAENEQYAEAIIAGGGAKFDTNDLDEIITEVMVLATERHPYRSVIIDPITWPYNNAVDRNAHKLARESGDGSDGTEFGRHKSVPDRTVRRLVTLLMQPTFDMNVVMTAHAKGKWTMVGGQREQVGLTFDAMQKLEYMFDLALEIQPRGDGTPQAIVKKTRIQAFPLGSMFPFEYEEIAARYGADKLDRPPGGIAALATPEQVARIKQLVDVLKIEPDVVDKWFAKANTDRFEEFSQDAATKVLEWLEARLAPTAPPVAQGAEA